MSRCVLAAAPRLESSTLHAACARDNRPARPGEAPATAAQTRAQMRVHAHVRALNTWTRCSCSRP
eukprot:6478714-Prymnesium_polylepis.1